LSSGRAPEEKAEERIPPDRHFPEQDMRNDRGEEVEGTYNTLPTCRADEKAIDIMQL
jgi:hypothetical protein